MRPSTIVTPAGGARFVCHMARMAPDDRGNAIASIARCLEAGAERVEIDIHSLAGADWVVTHDRRLEHATTASGAIGSATPGDIRACRYRDDATARPPLLSEVAALASAHATELQLDLKDWRPLPPERIRALVDAIAPARDRVIVSSGQDWNLLRIHRADPALALGFDPGHYIDHASEGSPFFLPRTMGAYGYRDDHPLAIGRTEDPADYLRERFEMLAQQAPMAREWFLSYRLVLQMLGDGFDAAAFLRGRGIDANAWTVDRGDATADDVLALVRGGIARITTNTLEEWRAALA